MPRWRSGCEGSPQASSVWHDGFPVVCVRMVAVAAASAGLDLVSLCTLQPPYGATKFAATAVMLLLLISLKLVYLTQVARKSLCFCYCFA